MGVHLKASFKPITTKPVGRIFHILVSTLSVSLVFAPWNLLRPLSVWGERDLLHFPFPISREFGEGVDSARGVAEIGVCLRNTVRAEIITELILKRAGPVIFKAFLLLELIAFGPIPVICPARGVKPENYWKR